MKNRTRIMVLVIALLLLALTGGAGMVSAMRASAGGATSPAAPAGEGAAGRVIDITAERFKFTPNLITIKKGETVTLRLTSQDVTHGFFLKPMKIDEVIVPGKPTELTLTPQVAGRFTTICDHFCGSGHGGMNMTIVVE
jgi:cytochrome c oxidase subunit 2